MQLLIFKVIECNLWATITTQKNVIKKKKKNQKKEKKIIILIDISLY